MPELSNEILLSIVIVGYNTRELLENCLRSVFENDFKQIEVIVIDNDSSDGTGNMVREKFPDAIFIGNSENRGFAAANNQGIKLSKGKYVLLLNPDTIVNPGCFQKCYDFMEHNPETGICGCKILNPDGTIQPSMRDFHNIKNCIFESLFFTKLFKESKVFGKYHGTSYDYAEIREAKVLLGAFLFIRRSLIKQIGLLDERFFIYSEETDFCFRSRQNNWKNMFFPDASIIHVRSSSTGKVKVRSFIYLHESLNKYLEKHFSSLYASFCRIILFAGLVLRILLWVFILILTLRTKGSDRIAVYWNTALWYLGLKK